MIEFKLQDGKSIHIEREAIEERILVSIFDKLEQAREIDKGMYNALKAGVQLMLTMGKINLPIPKGENTLEFLLAHYVTLGLDVLDKGEPLAVVGKVVEADAQAD